MLLLQVVLVVVGLAFSVHMICRANFMPTDTPAIFGLLVAGAFACGVGLVVSAASGDIDGAAKFAGIGAASFLAQCLWLRSHGFRALYWPSHSLRKQDAKSC